VVASGQLPTTVVDNRWSLPLISFSLPPPPSLSSLFPRTHVRTNGCPCICKSSVVFGSPSASHLSMSRRERRIHGNTPGQPGVRVRASASKYERAARATLSFACASTSPAGGTQSRGLLPPLRLCYSLLHSPHPLSLYPSSPPSHDPRPSTTANHPRPTQFSISVPSAHAFLRFS